MKLPEKKYVFKRDWETESYAFGWNSIIENTEILRSIVGENRAKENLLETKEYIFQKKTSYFKGMFDCIVEIEKLNKEGEK